MLRSIFGTVYTSTTGSHVYGTVYHVGVEAAREIALLARDNSTRNLIARHHDTRATTARYTDTQPIAARLTEATP